MPKTALKIGPRDAGRRMRLADFDLAEGQEGHLYELSRGVITVVDVPKQRHLAQLKVIKRQVHGYDVARPGIIDTIAGGGECKILLTDLDSERHPDLAIYKTPMPLGDDIWSRWVPEIVVEVVSLGSEMRDYMEKREEYFKFGSQEYWILDAAREEMLVLRRSRGRWVERIVRPDDVYRTRLLPGLEFSCASVFQAARSVDE